MESFYCELCNIQFKSKRCLTAHKKSQRHKKYLANQNSLKYKCICGKSYEHRQSLFNHRKTCSINDDVKRNQINLDNVVTSYTHCKVSTNTGQTNIEHKIIHKMQKDHRKEVSELKEENRLLKEKVLELSKVRTNRRRGINKHVRDDVIRKQNTQCNTCTKPLTEYNTNIDHTIGVQFGGTNDVDNLQALCVECHSEKTIKERRNCKKIRDAIKQILSEVDMVIMNGPG